MTDANVKPNLPVPFMEDCSATFQLTSPGYQMKPDKWLDIRYQYFKQLVEERFAKLVKVKAEDMYANLGTKLGVLLAEFVRSRDYLQNHRLARAQGLLEVERFDQYHDDDGLSKGVAAAQKEFQHRQGLGGGKGRGKGRGGRGNPRGRK